MKRRTLVQALVAGASVVRPAFAQEAFPSKPVRIVVPTPPGGGLDAVARLYGEYLAQSLKQSVLIDNEGGAGTLLALRRVAKAAPDGHTLLITANTVVTLPHINRNAGYALTDFAGVGDLTRSPMIVVVGASSPYKTLPQLVEAARKEAGAITYVSVGIGSTSHLPVEMLARTANIKLTLVPYKGTAVALPDVISGRVNLAVGNPPSVGELITAGKLRALAVLSDARTPAFPDVPTIKELGYPDARFDLYFVLLAPSGVPAGVRATLGEAVNAAKKEPEVRRRLALLAQEMPPAGTPEQLDAFLRQDEERMKRLVREANITAN